MWLRQVSSTHMHTRYSSHNAGAIVDHGPRGRSDFKSQKANIHLSICPGIVIFKYYDDTYMPQNTHQTREVQFRFNVVLMLAHRLRRWTNIKPTLNLNWTKQVSRW